MGVTRVIAVLAVASLLAYLMAQWTGGPQSTALTDASGVLSTNPFSNLPPWPTFLPPTPASAGTTCESWDLACLAASGASSVAYATAYIGAMGTYIGALGARVGSMVVSFLAWFFGSLSAVAGVTWGLFTAPLALYTGPWLILGVVLFLPLWASVAFAFLRIVRGTSSG